MLKAPRGLVVSCSPVARARRRVNSPDLTKEDIDDHPPEEEEQVPCSSQLA